MTTISSGDLRSAFATDGGGVEQLHLQRLVALATLRRPRTRRAAPFLSVVTPAGSASERTKTSPPSSGLRKPKPFSVSYHLTLPVGTVDLTDLWNTHGGRLRGHAQPATVTRAPVLPRRSASAVQADQRIPPGRAAARSSNRSGNPAVDLHGRRNRRPLTAASAGRRPATRSRERGASTSTRAPVAEVADAQVAHRDAGCGQRPAQRRLGPVDPGEPVGVTVTPYATRLDRQAAAGLSHVGRPQRRRRLADLRLGEPGVPQRRGGAALDGGPDAGTEAGDRVVGVGAGGDVRDIVLGGQRNENVEQLGLAEVAAVAVVGPVARPVHLVGLRGEVPHAETVGEVGGRPQLLAASESEIAVAATT